MIRLIVFPFNSLTGTEKELKQQVLMEIKILTAAIEPTAFQFQGNIADHQS